MSAQSKIPDALQKLRDTGRISPYETVSLRGLATGITVDAEWTPMNRIVALVEKIESVAIERQT